MAHFRIRDLKTINNVIFPIFDKYPLLTTKYFYYNIFKEAYKILDNSDLTKLEKSNLLEKLLLTKPSDSYLSPAWDNVSKPLDVNEAKKIVSKGWLVGFIEARSNFIIKKIENNYIFMFHLTLKPTDISNFLVLHSIKRIFHISNSVKYNHNENFELISRNSKANENIIKLLNNKLKSIKSLEFKLWSKGFSYNKRKNTLKIDKILKIKSNMNSKRLD
jgi:hypothetical protein